MIEKRKPGRPKGTTINASNRYVPLPVRLPQYLLRRLDSVGIEKGQTRTETVTEAIDDYLFKHQKLWIKR